ncbi:hypothetical protein ACI2LC_09160 [Nonomuraea wenchangensis]|uniref:hypothetical protein n=1 Tax=Nonomuraea wenchangensis TaxID=568860 RepID=UPI00384D5377
MRSALLLAATLAAGLMAGLFAGFAYAVMPGLAGAGDATFIEAMNQINVSTVNPLFLLVFLGGPVLGLAALILERRRAVAVGFALSVVMLRGHHGGERGASGGRHRLAGGLQLGAADQRQPKLSA